jgi:hypothetical protein
MNKIEGGSCHSLMNVCFKWQNLVKLKVDQPFAMWNDSFMQRSILCCGRKWSWPNVGKILAFVCLRGGKT